MAVHVTLCWSNSGVSPVKPEGSLEADLLIGLGHLQYVPEVDASGYQQRIFSRRWYLFHVVVRGESEFGCLTKDSTIEDKQNTLEDKQKHDAGADNTGDTMTNCC